MVRRLVEQAIEVGRLRTENHILQNQLRSKYRFENIVGNSPALRGVLDTVAKVADSDSTVLITPTTANAANIQRMSDLFVTAGTKQFTVTHGATANSDCTFTYAIQG